MQRITTEFSRGQAGRLWDSLVPAEQRVVTRARYLACQRNGGFRLRSFNVLESYSEAVEVEGTQTPATAVTVQVTSDDGVTTATMHALKLGGSWHWMLQPAEPGRVHRRSLSVRPSLQARLGKECVKLRRRRVPRLQR